MEELRRSLEALCPNALSLSEIVAISDYVAEKACPPQCNFRHVSVFGTGGDKLKTLNVSTLASIVASDHCSVVKVGTVAVTSKWGSEDFMNELRVKGIPVDLRPPSRFIALTDMGFAYRPNLRLARRDLFSAGIPDICKIAFPFTNYTNASCQVTGVSTPLYRQLAVRFHEVKRSDAIVLYSAAGCDELMPGENTITLIRNGKVSERRLVLDPNVPFDGLLERDTLGEQLQAAAQLLKPRPSAVVHWNAAAIVLAALLDELSFESALDIVRGSH